MGYTIEAIREAAVDAGAIFDLRMHRESSRA